MIITDLLKLLYPIFYNMFLFNHQIQIKNYFPISSFLVLENSFHVKTVNLLS